MAKIIDKQYDKFKNLINARYGYSAQDPAKDRILYKPDSEKVYVEEGKRLIDILIYAAYENVGSEFVYTDTDSVKYIGG